MTESNDRKATIRSGNTKQILSSRHFQLTLNQVGYYEDLISYLSKLKTLDYLISCKEIAPTTGHEHIHIYIHFKNCHHLHIDKLYGAHVEVCNGSPQQNYNYIIKDGNIIDEIGTRPTKGGRTIKDVMNMSIDERNNLPIAYKNIIDKINSQELAEVDNIDDVNKDIHVYYIQGPSGSGKTERAKKLIREYKALHPDYKINFYLKYENGFYAGATGAKIGCYDDFRDSHMKASEFINLIDYNKHMMNIKGGHVMNNYELLIITSIQPINDIYKGLGAEPSKQWTRRVEVIDLFDNKYNAIGELELDNI